MEGNKHKVLMTVIGAGTLLVALAGATFAYFSATSETTVQTVTTSNLNLTVTADDDTTHVTNIKPTDWSDDVAANVANEDIAQIHFTVESTSSANGTYDIAMTAPRLALNTGNDAAGNPLKGGSLSQVMYKVYKMSGDTYTPVTGAGASGNLSSLDTSTGTAVTPIEIITGAAISSNLSDHYVIFVYIENASSAQNQLQGLDFDIAVTGSAAQA